jgi:histidinol-phosphate aminotransferase
VMTRTFSKLFGLAALRLGWLYAQPPVVDVMHRLRGPFNVGTPAQVAGIASLEDLGHQERARAHNDQWLPWLEREISDLGLRVHPSVANFVLVSFGNGAPESADAASAWLERHGVLARSMGAYGLPDCLRMSVGLEDHNRLVVAALRDFLA